MESSAMTGMDIRYARRIRAMDLASLAFSKILDGEFEARVHPTP